MPFEKQEKAGGGRGGTTMAKISLRKSGSIGINSRCVEEYLEEEPEWCEIYFDPEDEMLGLSFREDETENSYKVTYSNGSATVAPVSILKNFELIPEVTEQFEVEQHEVDDDGEEVELLVIDTANPVAYYGSADDEQNEE